MATTMTIERLRERGAAMLAWQAAGGRIDALARLDRAVRHAETTDWPGREPGPEVRWAEPEDDPLELGALDLGFDPWGGP